MKEITLETEAARQHVEADLLASLGRAPTPLDRIAAEQISAAVVRGRRLRASGRDDTGQRQQIAQLMRASGFKPAPPASTANKPKPTSIHDLDWSDIEDAEQGAS
ncbi:hypothetical protein [Bradyrhizobium sp. HKCCYLS3013]|uniref:hypothetical protein n=1 Tax=Bradyrhizobium sp. HKCCYLS3013 TaxID=3420735 RepID=UPI003EBDAADA